MFTNRSNEWISWWKKKAWQHSLNKTVIYFWLKTKIVWTAHYKGIVKIFSPRLSDHFHTVHLACTHNLLQMKGKQKRILNKPVCNKKKKEEKIHWSCRKMTEHFGLVPSHKRKKPNRRAVQQHKRHKRHNKDIPEYSHTFFKGRKVE